MPYPSLLSLLISPLSPYSPDFFAFPFLLRCPSPFPIPFSHSSKRPDSGQIPLRSFFSFQLIPSFLTCSSLRPPLARFLPSLLPFLQPSPSPTFPCPRLLPDPSSLLPSLA
ncbi:hypothetical protein VPH35_130266 [Triticum aestivum]